MGSSSWSSGTAQPRSRPSSRAARRGGQRVEPDQRPGCQGRRSEARPGRDGQQRQRQHPDQLQAATVQRPAGPAGHQPGAGSQGLPGGAAAGRRDVRRGPAAATGRGLGTPQRRRGQARRDGGSGQAEGRGPEAPRRSGLRPREPDQVHAIHPLAGHLRGHRELDGRSSSRSASRPPSSRSRRACGTRR